jgi:hypothetical protein
VEIDAIRRRELLRESIKNIARSLSSQGQGGTPRPGKLTTKRSVASTALHMVTIVNILANERQEPASQMCTMETFTAHACKRCQHSNLRAVWRSGWHIRDQFGENIALSPWRIKGNIGASGYRSN